MSGHLTHGPMVTQEDENDCHRQQRCSGCKHNVSLHIQVSRPRRRASESWLRHSGLSALRQEITRIRRFVL